MWANALAAFSLADADPCHWEEAFRTAPLKAPGPTERSSCGFVLNPEGVYCDSLNGRHAFMVGIARRHLPKDAIEREVTLRGIEAASRGEDKPSWAEVETQMLAGAPIREERVPAIYDSASQVLLVWGSTRIATDYVLPAMIQAIGGCRALPWVPACPMQTLATQWLRTGELPLPFSLGEEVELATSDGDGKVKVSKQDIREASVLALLEEGRLVKSMEIRWAGKLSFRINAKADLRRIGPPECKLKPRQAFETWPDIVDDLFGLYHGIVQLTGGEREPGEDELQENEGPARGQGSAATQAPQTPTAHETPAPTGPPPALVVIGDSASGREAVEFLSHHQARRPWGNILVQASRDDVHRTIADWAVQSGTRAAACQSVDLATVRGVVLICPEAANEPLLQAVRKAGVPLVVHRGA